MAGLFITFEGGEGAGKSTQIERLRQTFEEKGHDVLMLREPGGTFVGEEIRRLVKEVRGEDAVCDSAELLLFAASRAQLMTKKVLPHLEKGGVVICDRFADSTTAYQGYARGWDLNIIEDMHKIAVGNNWPDITFLLNLDLKQSIARRLQRESDCESVEDRLEAESEQFHQRVADGFLQIAKDHPNRVKVINAFDTIENVSQTIHTSLAEAGFSEWI